MNDIEQLMAESLVQHGRPQADVDAMAAADAAGVVPDVAPLAPSGPRTMEDAMRDALIERGIVTQAQIEAGGQHDQSEAKPLVGGDATPFERALGAGFEPPSDPSGYRLPTIQHFDAEQGVEFRTFCHRASVDNAMAQVLAREWDGSITRTIAAKNDPNAAELYRRTSEAALRRQWGADFDSNMEHARAEVRRLAIVNTNFLTVLDRTGMGNSPMLIRQLAMRGLARS